jgi:hypothetical protein
MTERAVIIIAAAELAAANAWMKANIDKEGGEKSFSVPIFNNEDELTHYWCDLQCTASQKELLSAYFGLDCYDGNLQSKESILASNQLHSEEPLFPGVDSG